MIPFVRKSMAINMMILNILDDLLGLPQGTLADLHTLEELSGSEARVIKSQPHPSSMNEVKASLASHTDFGSLVSNLHDGFIRYPLTTPIQISYRHSCTINSVDCRLWYQEPISGSISRSVEFLS